MLASICALSASDTTLKIDLPFINFTLVFTSFLSGLNCTDYLQLVKTSHPLWFKYYKLPFFVLIYPFKISLAPNAPVNFCSNLSTLEFVCDVHSL